MKKVMVFGTFDLLHDGHKKLFIQAKKYGTHLVVVVARDSSVKNIKGFAPKQNELERLKNIQNTGLADTVLLGYEDDFYRIIEEIRPAVLCFGYDQNHLNAEKELKKRGISIETVTLDSFHPLKYKSSIIRKKQK